MKINNQNPVVGGLNTELEFIPMTPPSEELVFETLPLIEGTYQSKYKGSEIDEGIARIFEHYDLLPAEDPHGLTTKVSKIITKTVADWESIDDKFITRVELLALVDNDDLLIYIYYTPETRLTAKKSGIGNNAVEFNSEIGELTLIADNTPSTDIQFIIVWQPRILEEVNDG